MRILFINETNPFASSNASNNRFLSLAEGLLVNGCEIDLVFTNGFYSWEEKRKFSKVGTKNAFKYCYLLPVDFERFILRQILYRFLPIKYYILKIQKLLIKEKYDIIWVGRGPKAILIGLSLTRLKRELCFHIFHEISEYSWIGISWIGLKDKHRIHNDYLYKFLPNVDFLALMTNNLKTYYQQFVSSKTKIIHLAMTVDFSRFQIIPEFNRFQRPYIAYCGTMNNGKDGVDILVKSFIALMGSFASLHLYIAGPLIPRNDYLLQRSLIAFYSADNRITYLGNLSKEEIPSFLMHAEVVAMARPESTQAEGGFPTKLGEYLASGKPVCVTDVGEIGKYLKDNESAFMAKPGSVDSFADALSRALTNKNALNVGECGKLIALKFFNSEIQSKILYDFLTDCV
jgi:glycosyltransferase involved in cell wall biosynthesis